MFKFRTSVAIPAFLTSLAFPLNAAGQDASSTNDEGARTLDAVTVTAQRREQALSDTPLAIAAYSGENLEARNVDDIGDLQRVIPTLDVQQQGSAVRISLRGISTDNNSAGGDPSVSFHVDGVYQPRMLASTYGLLNDVERIEVLRGPQGTLYGRNSTGGSINVINKTPSSEFEGEFEQVFGSYDLVRSRAVLNVPVGDGGFRFSGIHDAHDGFTRNALTGERSSDDRDAFALRGQFANSLNGADFTLRAERIDFGGVGVSQVVQGDYPPILLPLGPDTFGVFPLEADPPAGFGAIPNPNDVRLNPRNDPQSLSDTLTRVNGDITFDLGGLDFILLAAFQDQDMESIVDGDYSSATIFPVSFNQSSEYFMLEGHVAGETPNGDWLVGVFGMSEDITDEVGADAFLLAGVPAPLVATAINSKVKSESFAIFGQASWEFWQAFRFTSGVRYTVDEKSAFTTTDTTALGTPTSTTETRFNPDWDAFTWRASLDWQPTPEVLYYASVSRGYKAGGFSLGAAPYDPEEVLSFEAGVKWSFLNNRANLAIDAFHYDYDDLQITFLDIIDGVPATVTTNAGASELHGLEFDGAVIVTDWLQLDGSIAILNSEYKDTILIDPSNPAAGPQDLEGEPLARAPELTARIGFDTEFAIDGVGIVSGRFDTVWTDEIAIRPWAVAPFDIQDAYARVDASVRWAPNDQIYFEVFGNNLTDETVKTFSGYSAVVNSFQATYAPPRTYGVKIGANF